MAMTAKEKREARAREIESINKDAIIHPDQVASAAGEIVKPSGSSETVIVALKLGVAYFDIQHTPMVERFEQNPQGGRTIKEGRRSGPVVRLRGTSYPRGTTPKGFPERPEIVAGAALNYGIDKDWFDEWLSQNARNPLVINNMIFAYTSRDAVVGQAREQIANLSGLDPINPEKGKDPRVPHPTRSELQPLEAGVK